MKTKRFKARVITVAPNKYSVKSNTKRDVRYEVTVSRTGVLSCQCEARLWQPGILCSHAQQVHFVRELKAAQPAPYVGYDECFDPRYEAVAR